ncbi:hypothetical protein O5O45_16735 [Hahella aquimaris]|uniref:Uncharacterized protein n=1 Tax=Hahella chejuensis (strain KCTC 2396) TaxID=349521 RepID=Q2SKP8_HAHCH|nr:MULTISPECIES: hypothetical protein [Hahella]ABC28776.1 hypothetical protein HCH_01943 [Hahella chejuensis KCTC 2396]WLQ11393.1 hypothetical protein O5O45_16735 [Hahella sp. HNIBRBA332]
MQVSSNGDIIRIQMPVSTYMMAFYYKCVDGEWVRYKRERLGTLH